MIWESIPIMTSLDLAFIAIAVGGLTILSRVRRHLPPEGGRWGILLTVGGLSLVGVFYLADLLVMHVAPRVIGRPEAMALMQDMHLNYAWVVLLLAAVCVLTGVGLCPDAGHYG